MSEPRRPGTFYARACKRFARAQDPERGLRLAREISRISAQIREAETLEGMERMSGQASAAARRSAAIGGMRRRLARLERVRDQRDFRKAMRITGMGLTAQEAVRFSSAMAALSFAAVLPAAAASSILLGLDPLTAVAAVAGLAVAVPLAVFAALVTYPERLARSLEAEAFGSAPEAVNYMAMSMELSPSLDTAVGFAAVNAEGPMADELGSVVWSVKARKFATTEEALMSYAAELRGSNEELASAMYGILSAAKDTDRGKAGLGLRRACDTVLTGTRQRVEGFAASLGTPATVLFSLGILLPMIIGSMLPMLSVGGFGGGMPEQQAQAGSWLPTLALSAILMNLAFPAAAFAYARLILSRRPGIRSVRERSEGMCRARFAGGAAIAALSAALAVAAGTHVEFWGLEWAIASLIFLAGTAMGLGFALAPAHGTAETEKAERLESQIPDMLFQLGSALSEGMAVEKAVERAAEALSGTEAGDFLGSVVARLRRSGASLGEVLFSEKGIAATHPSGKVRAALRLSVESAGKDPETAGGMLIAMSNHMRELANADREMRIKLRSTVDSMKNTAILFGPVIMGVTVGLYGLLSASFSGLGGQEPMPVPYFIIVIGAYLLATVSVIMYFCSGIERGRGFWKKDVAAAVPVSALIFCAAALGSLMAFC